MYAMARVLRRVPWGVWISGFLLALDGLWIPLCAAWLVTSLGGGESTAAIAGIVLPPWTWLALGPLALLSVVGAVALFTVRGERGFRVASTAAVA